MSTCVFFFNQKILIFVNKNEELKNVNHDEITDKKKIG